MQRKPRNIFGGVVWILVIIALGYGGFVAYERWWGTVEFKTKVSEVRKSAGKGLGSATEWVKNLVRQSAKETAGNIIVSAGDSLGSLGEKIKDGGTGVLGPGAKTEMAGIFAPAVGLSASVGVPLSFFLVSDPSYSVDWGDGKKESKTVSGKSGFTISHRWSVPGRYEIVIKAANGIQSSEETFMVNIIP